MARRTAATLQDLVAAVAEPGESLRAWCERVGFPERTLFRMATSEENTPRMGTLTLLAGKLSVDLPTLRAAIEASRAAAKD
jgi:hypothetical protein